MPQNPIPSYIYDLSHNAHNENNMRFLPLLLTIALPAAASGANLDIQPIPDLPLSNVPPASATAPTPPSGEWSVSLGGGLSYAPRYEGAARDRLRFMPLLEANYNNGKIFISPLRGIGYNFSDDKALQYGVRLTLSHGRRQSADPHLNGMGNLRYAPEAGLFFNQRLALWYVSGGVSTSTYGAHAELGGGLGFPLSAADRVRVGLMFNWGDARYNQSYFGVTPAQAAASGGVLSAYSAGAGFKDYALSANWAHNFSKEWFSSAGLSYKWLAGSARHSPLTQRSSAGSFNFLLGYRF